MKDIAGTHESVHLLQYINPEIITTYSMSHVQQSINRNVRVRFAPSGNRFASVDTAGELRIVSVLIRIRTLSVTLI